MGILSQLKLTLWKHIKIRRRQPVTLALEFLWPLVVFLIVTSVRHMFPPEARSDCAYKARAMPSAGLLPFMQSFVCNLDNQCDNFSSYEEIPSYKDAKAGPLVNKLYPLIQRKDVKDILTELPTTMKLASHAVTSLDTPPVRQILSELLYVRDLFKDQPLLRSFLVARLGMDVDLVNNILGAVVNPGQLLRILPSSGFMNLACDPQLLGQVFEFPDPTKAALLSDKLCGLIRAPPAQMLQQLMMQVNVTGLIRKVAVMLNSLGSDDIAHVLDSVGGIVWALQDIPILSSLTKVPISGDTEQLAEYLQGALEFLSAIKGLDLDLNFLGEMLDDIEQIIGPNEFFGHIKAVGKHIHRIIQWSQNGIFEESVGSLVVSDVFKDPVGFRQYVKNQTELSDETIDVLYSVKVKPGHTTSKEICYKLCNEMAVEDVLSFEGSLDTGTLMQVWTLMCSKGNCLKAVKEDFSDVKPSGSGSTMTVASISKDLDDLLKHVTSLGNQLGEDVKKAFPAFDLIWKVTTTALSVAFLPEWDINNSSFVDSLSSTLETLPGYLPNDMRLPVLNLVTAAEVTLTVAVVIAKKAAEVDQQLYKFLSHDQQALANMMSLGPDVMSSLAEVFAEEKTLQTLLDHPKDVQALFCNDSLVKSLLDHPNSPDAEKLHSFLCSLPIKDISDIFSSIEGREKLVQTVEKSLRANDETDIDTAFELRVRSLCRKIWELTQAIQAAGNMSSKWDHFMRQSNIDGQDMKNARWKEVHMKMEAAKYHSMLNVYTVFLGQSLETKKFTGRAEKVMKQVGVMINAITDEALAVPEEFLRKLAQYWPSVIRVFLNSLGDASKVRPVINRRTWSDVVCNQTAMEAHLSIPASISSEDFTRFLCNLTTFVEVNIFQVNWFEKPFVKMIKKLSDGDQPGDEKIKIHWKHSLRQVRIMLTRYGRLVSKSLEYGPEVDELTGLAKQVFSNMNVTNILKFSVNVVSIVMEFVDRQLVTIQPWGWKHIKALLGMVDMLVQHVNKELEKIIAENKVETPVLTFGLPIFTNMTRQVIRLFPDFVDVFANLFSSRLGDFISRVMVAVRNKEVPCDGMSVTNMVDFTMESRFLVKDLEKMACSSWKLLASEIIQYPLMFRMVWKIREATRDKDVELDWTKTTGNLQRLIDNSDSLTRFNGSLFPDVEGFTVENANAAMGRLVDALNFNSTEKGIRFVLVIVDVLIPVMENIFRKSELEKVANMTALLDGLRGGNYSTEQTHEAAWFTFKAVLKTANIVLKDVSNFFKNMKNDNVTFSNIFGMYGPTILGGVFDALPDYVNTIIHSILNPDLHIVLDELRKNGNLSFGDICSKPKLLERLIITPNKLQDVNRTQILDSACKLMSSPELYLAIQPYIYTWVAKTLDQVVSLWQDTNPHTIVIHLVDMMDSVEFLSNHAADIVTRSVNVTRHFQRLVDRKRWDVVGEGLAHSLAHAQFDTWKFFLRYNISRLNDMSVDNRPMVYFLRIANGTLATLNLGLSQVADIEGDFRISGLFQEQPEVQKMVVWLEANVRSAIQVLWYTLAVSPLKITSLLITANYHKAVCSSSPTTYFTVPPGGNLSALAEMKDSVCSLHWDKIVVELGEEPVQDQTRVATKDFSNLAVGIINTVLSTADFHRRFPEFEMTNSVFAGTWWKETVQKVSESIGTIKFDNIQSWIEWLETNNPQISRQFDSIGLQPFFKASYHFLRWITDKLEHLTAPNLDLTSIFQSDEQLDKASNFLNQHAMGIVESIIFTTITDPSKLYDTFGKNVSTDQICQRLTEDVLIVPPNSKTDMHVALKAFCSLNISSTSMALQKFMSVEELQKMYSENDDSFPLSISNVKLFWQQLNRTQNVLQKLVGSHSQNADVPDVKVPKWLMRQVWTNLGNEMKQKLVDNKWDTNFYYKIVFKMFESAGWKRVIYVTNNLVSNVLRRFSTPPENVSGYLSMSYLQTLFSNFSTLEKTMPFLLTNLVEISETFIYTYIKSPEKINTIVNSTSLQKTFCEITNMSSAFDATRESSWTSMSEFQEIVCSLNLQDLMTEAQDWFGLTDWLKLSNESSMEVNSDEFVKNLATASALWQRLKSTTTPDSQWQLPTTLNSEKWNDMLLRINAQFASQLGTELDSNASTVLNAVQSRISPLTRNQDLKSIFTTGYHLLEWSNGIIRETAAPTFLSDYKAVRTTFDYLQTSLMLSLGEAITGVIDRPSHFWTILEKAETGDICKANFTFINQLPLYRDFLCTVDSRQVATELLRFMNGAGLQLAVESTMPGKEDSGNVTYEKFVSAFSECLTLTNATAANRDEIVSQFRWLDANKWSNFWRIQNQNLINSERWMDERYLLSWLSGPLKPLLEEPYLRGIGRSIAVYNRAMTWASGRLQHFAQVFPTDIDLSGGDFRQLGLLLGWIKENLVPIYDTVITMTFKEPVQLLEMTESSNPLESLTKRVCQDLKPSGGGNGGRDTPVRACEFGWTKISSAAHDLFDIQQLILSKGSESVDQALEIVELGDLGNLTSNVLGLLSSLRWLANVDTTAFNVPDLSSVTNSNAIVQRLNSLSNQATGRENVHATVSWILEFMFRRKDNGEIWRETLEALDIVISVSRETLQFLRENSNGNQTIWTTLRSWFSDRPLVQTFVNVLEDFPNLATTFVGFLLNPDEIRPLAIKLGTLTNGTKLDKFCVDFRLEDYFHPPSGINETFADVQKLLCNSDWKQFYKQFNPFFKSNSTRDDGGDGINSTKSFNSSAFLQNLNQMQKAISLSSNVESQPTIGDFHLLPWINRKDWTLVDRMIKEFLDKIKTRDDLTNVTIRYVSLLDSLPYWLYAQEALELINMQMELMLRQMRALTDPTTSKPRKLYDILTDTPVMTQLVHQFYQGVRLATDLTVSFVFAKQVNYFETFRNETEYFCSPKSNFQVAVIQKDLPNRETVDQLFELLCHQPPSEWTRSFVDNLKIEPTKLKSLASTIMFLLPPDSPWALDPKWQESTAYNWTRFTKSVQFVDAICLDPPAAFYPKFEWLSWRPVFKTFGNVLPDMIDLSADPICPLMPDVNYKPFTVIIQLLDRQLMLADEYERLLCDFPRMNLSAIYRRLKEDLQIIDTLRELRVQIGDIKMEVIPGRSYIGTCNPLFNATAEVADTLNALVVDYVESETRVKAVQDCFQEDTQAAVLKEIDKYLKLVSKALPLLNLPNITSLGNTSALQPLVEDMLNYIKSQLPIFVTTKSLLKANNTLATDLIGSTAAATLLDGSININRLVATGYDVYRVADIFCNTTKFNRFVVPPAGVSLDAIAADASTFLCPQDGGSTKDRLVIAERFVRALDRSKINEVLPALQMQNLLSFKLAMDVGRRLGDLGSAMIDIKGAIGTLDIESLVSNVTIRKLMETLLPLVYTDNLFTLFTGLDKITEDISPIIYGSFFEEDLQMLSEGLNGIYTFIKTRLQNDTIPIKQAVIDTEDMNDFLLSAGIKQDMVDVFLNTNMNFSVVLLKIRLTKLVNFFCDIDTLEWVFGLRSNREVGGAMFHALCDGSQGDGPASKFLDLMFDNINFMGILKHAAFYVLRGVSEKAGVTPDDAMEALESLLQAKQVVPIIASFFKDMQSEVQLLQMVKSLDPASLAEGEISPEVVSLFGNMVCGHPIRTFDEYFRLLENIKERPPQEKDQAEMKSLPSSFCQQLYQQVAYRPAGSVIWGFVKPFIRGKILFAPNNELTRKIVVEANRTFDGLAQAIDMVQSWTQGFSLMGQFADNQLYILQDLLSLPLAKSVVVGMVGPEMAKVVLNMTAVLDAMGKPQRFLGAASALGEGLKCFETNRFVGFNAEKDMEDVSMSYERESSFLAGIVFKNLTPAHLRRSQRSVKSESLISPASGLPKHISYKIRMDIDDVPTTKMKKERFWKPGPEDNFIEHLRYLRGFVEMQDMMDNAIIRVQTGQDIEMPGTFLQQLPHPCYWKDEFGYFLRVNVPAVTTLAWIFIIAFFVRELVLDREMMLEQIMHVMGLKSWVGWLSWFINCFVVMLVTNIGSAAILKYGGIFPYSDPIVLFTFMFTFALSSIMFCYLVSIWFKTATVAAITAVLLYLISYLPFIVVLTLEAQLTFVPRILLNLLMSTSFSQGCLYVSRFEEQQQGAQWDNLWDSPIVGDDMNLAWACIMMAIDAVIYFVLATYFNGILKASARTGKKPWNFLFYPFCGPTRRNNNKSSMNINQSRAALELLSNGGNVKNGTTTLHNESMKMKEKDLKVGIKLNNLRKVFNAGQSSEKVAVEGLTLDFYEGQITTLLGQNGAGKTTTINMLTGLYPPVSGEASIYGRNVDYDFEQIRQNLGICPQYNVLFDLLTVREHLEFYGALKGLLTATRLKHDIDKMIDAMGLAHRQHELAQNLSGGMRRRLCVAIAFVGGSQTIILDEPTSGVDPVARRHIWDLVVQYKKGRTILLTTHHLDEADILSDRVAIIHQGKLLCCGPPMNLKRHFGSGYHITINRGNSDMGSDSDSGAVSTSSKNEHDGTCDTLAIFMFIRSYIPNVQLINDFGCEAVFCLPYCTDSGDANPFDQFFLDLEKHQSRLSIGGYGLSCTTLEEVFMNVCMQADAGLPITSQGHKILMLAKQAQLLKDDVTIKDTSVVTSKESLNGTDPAFTSVAQVLRRQESQIGADAWLSKTLYQAQYKPLTGWPLKVSQFKAILVKRFHHTRRDWRGFITCVVLPCVFVAVAMGFTLIRPTVEQFSPSILLTPSLYGPNSSSFFKLNADSGADFARYPRHLLSSPGLGTSCLASDPPEGVYQTCVGGGALPEHVSLHRPQCQCSRVVDKTCSGSNSTFELDRYYTETTDVVYNLTDGEVNPWIIATYFEFIERRYGGWTFGAKRHAPALPGSDENIVVWFNNKGFHAMPSYANAKSNALLRSFVDATGEDASLYGISTYSHPLHLSKMQLGMEALLHHVADVGVALVFLVSFSFIPAGFVIYLVRERMQEEKRLQFISGVGPLLYWSAALFSDILMLTVPIALSAIIIAIFDLPIYMYGHNFAATLAMLFMFGWATTPLMYILEKFFNEPSLASMILFCMNVFIGVNTTVCTLLFYLFQNSEAMKAALKFLRYFFLIFPQYAFAGGLIDLTKNYIQAEVFLRFGDTSYVEPFSMELLGLNFIVLGLQGCFFFIVNLLLEYMPHNLQWIESRRNKLPTGNPSDDSDIQAEREKVLNKDNSSDLMRLADLTKIYDGASSKILAVDRLCLSIPKGECFGLLGINGAGKTTTFRMLTGEIHPTFGEALFNNKSISQVVSNGSHNIGYCPQMNALDDLLTAEELLSVYAGLRGIPEEDVPLAVYKAVVQFNLQTHARDITKTYSCGTKRKLCAAIAVMGNADLILMDEPTSGMDPTTRRLVWNNVRQITKDKRSVILTSHSMEECDTLCTRLAIMVNGRFRCLGSPQYLKHKFGDGYTVTLRIGEEPNNYKEIMSFIENYFPGAVLKAQHCNTVEFLIPSSSATLGDIFSNLESGKESLGMMDFSVTQTTLDQVFVNFVREQADGLLPSRSVDGSGCHLNLAMNIDDEIEPQSELRPSGLTAASNGTTNGTASNGNHQLAASDIESPPEPEKDDFQVTQF